ncbi:MAG: enolase [Armatimonadetes bacterium]|nr:enolase [Armatimonadota bacterium]
MPLQITAVERITLNLPFHPVPKQWTAREVYNWSIVEVCRVLTNSDLVGYGETLPHYTWGRVSEAAANRVIGENPASLLGDDTLGAGLQMAVYDLAGKAMGVPSHALMGRKVRDYCPIAWWAIDMSAEAWVSEVKDALAEGYTAFKTKHRPWFDILEQLDALNAFVPPHFRFDSDANAFLLNAGHAIPILKEIERRYPWVAIFETPIPQGDIEGSRKIRQQVQTPIAMHFGEPPFMTAVREEVCDGFVCACGVANMLRQGTLAAEAKKPFFIQLVGTGLTTAHAMHLGVVLTMAQWPAVTCMNMYPEKLLKEPLKVEGGYIRVPEGPGLGVEVDEDALERYRMEEPYEHPKPRLLLSVKWTGGRVTHYADIWDMWREFGRGNEPVDERGVRLHVTEDDGSKEWEELFTRAQKAPVRERIDE